MNQQEAARLIDAAICRAAAISEPTVAYDVLAEAARTINRDGDTKPLRLMFSRPGGSWSAMGHGCKQWLLAEDLVSAARRLVRAVERLELP